MASLDEGRCLDGNALAGLLRELFDRELTQMVRGCQSCGTEAPIGAHRLWGTVLRCPACGDVALTVVTTPDRHIVRLRGSWTFELARP